MKKEFRSFEDTRKFVQKCNIKGQKQWREYCRSGKKPDDIPSNPNTRYKNKGWKGYDDWLGMTVKRPTYEEYKKWIQRIGVKSEKDLRKISKFPKGYPKDPYYHYKKQGTWKSMGDFFGTGNISPQERSKQFLSFEDARKEVRVLAQKYRIKNWDDWKKAKRDGKIPDNIPWAPNSVYSKKRKKK